jgi:tRNA A-37 threonylcarbamoyl transferase component Bud32
MGEARDAINAPAIRQAATFDIGAGDQEAPANAIPNIIARLVETETWRNAATVVMGLLLIFLGYWSYHGIRNAIAETQVGGLEALLGTAVRGLDVWVDEHRTTAIRQASDPMMVERARVLVAASREPGVPSVTCANAATAEATKALAGYSQARGIAAALIVDRGGLVLAADRVENCGRRIRSEVFRRHLDRALDGSAQFVRPIAEDEIKLAATNVPTRPIAWLLAPIGRGVATSALALADYTDGEFTSVFTSARPGNTTEAFAFAENGSIVTPIRFVTELVTAGTLPESTPDRAVFIVEVRDRGLPREPSQAAIQDPAARPLTEPAARALAARGRTAESDLRGVVSIPYRSYHGAEVIGAWRWLPAYHLGVVAEIAATEAFAPMRYLWISFAVIGGLTVLMLGAALFSSVSLSRLQQQFGRLQRLGAYTLERQISEGGMATIYLARHALLKRPTAIKVLKATVANDEFIHRFEREVQLASQLLHPNTVEVYDFGRTREGQPYYVMEYLDGVTLAELIAHSGPIPPGRAIHVLRQVAAALREAHKRGMIHRDVKPENVMLCRRGEDDVVKLLDFGLVKNLERVETRDITKQIKILGTPRYMAPERIVNPADVDARSDIYALGAVGYFLVTGKPIFDGNDNLDISNQVLHAPAPRAAAAGVPGIPDGLDALLAACLEKDRARRPQNADAVIEALDRISTRLAWTQVDAAAWWASYRESRGVGP